MNDIEKKKWQKLLRFSKLFQFIPFVDFVLVAGSMAYGEVHEDSDFDVIVGAKFGRIFSVRFLCALIFGVVGIRRKKTDKSKNTSNKFCFNHFVTPASYEFAPPRNKYWKNLYKNLVPIYGDKDMVKKFFRANEWSGRARSKVIDDDIWVESGSLISRFSELVFSDWFGDLFEKLVKNYQIKRIERSIKRGFVGYQPRLKYSDEELEFHIDTRRIEEMLDLL